MDSALLSSWHHIIAQSNNSITTDRRLCISRSKILTGKCNTIDRKNMDGKDTGWRHDQQETGSILAQTSETRSGLKDAGMLDEPDRLCTCGWMAVSNFSLPPSLSLSLLSTSTVDLSTNGITVSFYVSCIVIEVHLGWNRINGTMGAASIAGAPCRSRSCRRRVVVNTLACILLFAAFAAASVHGADSFDDSVTGLAASTVGDVESGDVKVQGNEEGEGAGGGGIVEDGPAFVAGSGASEDEDEGDDEKRLQVEEVAGGKEGDEDGDDTVVAGLVEDDDESADTEAVTADEAAEGEEEAAVVAEDGGRGAIKAASLVESAVSYIRGLFGAEEETRTLSQRKYVQTKERKGRKKQAQGGITLSKKEMKILRLRRRRRRRRRKCGQTLADVGVGAKQNANGGGANGAGGGKKKKTFANGALPHRIQDRVNDGDDAASSSEDKEFADRASSRTRDSMEDEEEEEDAPTVRGDSIENDSPREQRNKGDRPGMVSTQQQQQSQTDASKGGTSSDDDGPQMTAGAPVSDDATIRWRCAYPGEKVLTTDIPESVSMTQQISFAPPAPQPKPKGNSWLNGWIANGGSVRDVGTTMATIAASPSSPPRAAVTARSKLHLAITRTRSTSFPVVIASARI